MSVLTAEKELKKRFRKLSIPDKNLILTDLRTVIQPPPVDTMEILSGISPVGLDWLLEYKLSLLGGRP